MDDDDFDYIEEQCEREDLHVIGGKYISEETCLRLVAKEFAEAEKKELFRNVPETTINDKWRM